VAPDIEREQDFEELRRVALALKVANEQLANALARKCREVEALRGGPGDLQATFALVEELTRKAAVLEERLNRVEGAEGSEGSDRKARSRSGPTPQPELPVVEQTFELDEPDRACPSCGGELQPMAGQFETSEMIDVVEVSYRVVRVKQQKYVCRCGGCVETAPGPERATSGGRYSLGFAVKVAIDKYLDHLPLARQERILARHGLVVTSQALWDQLDAAARRVQIVDEALYAHVLAQPVIGLDQTGWPKLGAGRGEKPWQMWCLTAPGVVVHRIRDDKSAATFKALVGGYQGVIVGDALQTHAAGAREGPGIVLAGCWAHYPDPVVIQSGLPAAVEDCRQSHKIIRATARPADASIGCASPPDPYATRREGASGDRDVASGWARLGHDRCVPRLGTSLAVALAGEGCRRRPSPHAFGRGELHAVADRTASWPSYLACLPSIGTKQPTRMVVRAAEVGRSRTTLATDRADDLVAAATAILRRAPSQSPWRRVPHAQARCRCRHRLPRHLEETTPCDRDDAHRRHRCVRGWHDREMGASDGLRSM
jgi:transposase